MRGTAALLVGFVVFAACLPAPASAATSSPSPVAGTQIEPDDVLLEVSVHSDGSATWTVEYRIRLDDDNTTAAFESVQEDVERNATAFARPFADRMRSTAAAASNATGREMAVRNVTVTATRRQLPQEYGVITYRFQWTGFAAVDGDSLRVGDALAGFFLDGETTLLVSWPDEYTATNVVPAPDERRANAVVWIGPTDFTAGEPRVDLQQSDAGTGGGEPGGTDGTPTPSDDGAGVDLGALLVAGVLGALLAAGGIWYYWRSRSPPEPRSGEAVDAEGGAADTTAEPDAPSGAASGGAEPEPTAEASSAAGSEPEAEPESEPEPELESEPEPEPPEELLSNEERVRRLLKQRGGRMKQQEVAEALDWSAAKTSQIVTKMRDEDELDSFRLGRENVLSLPEVREDESE